MGETPEKFLNLKLNRIWTFLNLSNCHQNMLKAWNTFENDFTNTCEWNSSQINGFEFIDIVGILRSQK